MISKLMEDNLKSIKDMFHNSSDLVEYKFLTLIETKATLIYIDGLYNKNGINDNIVKPLMESLVDENEIKNTISASENEYIYTMEEVIKAVTNGLVVLFHENLDYGLSIDLIEFERRSVEQSMSERVIRGPKEAFVEDINVNRTLIRRKIKNNNLVFEDYIFGNQTNTKLSIVYIDDIVNPEILKDLKKRLDKVELEFVLDAHYIDEVI